MEAELVQNGPGLGLQPRGSFEAVGNEHDAAIRGREPAMTHLVGIEGYRPAAQRNFVSAQGALANCLQFTTAILEEELTTGEVCQRDYKIWAAGVLGIPMDTAV